MQEQPKPESQNNMKKLESKQKTIRKPSENKLHNSKLTANPNHTNKEKRNK